MELLVEVTQEQVQWAVDRFNHRPRKVLGFRTPFEVLKYGSLHQITVRRCTPKLNPRKLK